MTNEGIKEEAEQSTDDLEEEYRYLESMGGYELVRLENDFLPNQCVKVVYSRHNTIEQAMRARKVSGDVIVHANTSHVVANMGWLWEWERKDFKSYAHRIVAKAIERLGEEYLSVDSTQSVELD